MVDASPRVQARQIGLADDKKEDGLALEMRERCETCPAPLAPDSEAYICTYECTYCADCRNAHGATCPNCGGELVRRPRPAQSRAKAG